MRTTNPVPYSSPIESLSLSPPGVDGLRRLDICTRQEHVKIDGRPYRYFVECVVKPHCSKDQKEKNNQKQEAGFPNLLFEATVI